MGVSFCFRKNERITSKLLLDQLFSSKEARAITSFPLRVVFLEVDRHESDAKVQVLFSVSKRHFKHAVDRNRVKRQLREAYRMNKSLLPEIAEGRQLLVAFIWITDKILVSDKVESAMVKALQKIKRSMTPAVTEK